MVKELVSTNAQELHSTNGSGLRSVGEKIEKYLKDHMPPQGDAMQNWKDREVAGRIDMAKLGIPSKPDGIEESARVLWAAEQMLSNGRNRT